MHIRNLFKPILNHKAMRVVKNFKAQADLSLVELPKWKAERMYIQGYRFIGKHSAIKICEWTKKGIRGCSQCYKHQFYGISSLQCIQMTPTAFFCDFNCLHCWRSLNFTLPKQGFKWESPEFIINNCIKVFRDSKEIKTDMKQ